MRSTHASRRGHLRRRHGLGLLAPTARASVEPTARKVPAALTIKVGNCDDCTIGAVSASTSDYQDVWSQDAKVKDGAATFKVPADRMHSLSFTVGAPWEGNTGYATGVVARYAKTKPGDVVTFTAARTKKKASGCYAGSPEKTVTLRLKVRKVKVDGQGGRVWGTIAWFKATQQWQRPMERAVKGVIGRQDVLFCEPKA